MVYHCGVTAWQTGRGGAALLAAALSSGLSTSASIAQTTPAPGVSPVVANQVVQSPIDLYRTWQNMAGQVSQRLARANDRLPKGPIAGLTGKRSFVADHMKLLNKSVKILEGDAKIPSTKLKEHQARVLTFLNRATEIDRLLNDLERSEADDNAGNNATLRKNITALAAERLFGTLQPSTPARLRVVWPENVLAGIYAPNAINRVTVAIENTGDEIATNLTVTLAPSNSLIASVTDKQGACSAIGASWTCRTGALGSGQQWPIAVTFRHPDPYQVGAGSPVSVGVSIATAFANRPAGNTVTISYKVANCQANLGAELARIGASEGTTLRAALTAVQSGTDSLNGTWISKINSPLSDKLRQMFSTAAGIVEARGGDPWFTTTDDGRAVAQVVDGLEAYFQQGGDGAKCALIGEVIATNLEKLTPLGQRMALVAASRKRSLAAARAAIISLEQSAGLEAPAQAAQNRNTRALLARLDEALNANSGATSTAGGAAGGVNAQTSSGRSLSQLEALSAKLPNRSGNLGEAQLEQAKIALASIEASVYFELAQGRYEALRQSFEATFAALLAAQKARCVCKAGNIVVSSEKASAPIVVATPDRARDPHPPERTLVSRRVINPPSPRPKPIDHQLDATKIIQPINSVRAAARRAAKKRRLRRLD